MGDHLSTKAEWINAVLERYEQPLLRHAVRIIGDVEMARDVVQDTFLKLCKSDRNSVEDHLAAWLYTVCRNRALDIQKKEGRMGPLSNNQMISDIRKGPAEIATDNEIHGLVLNALNALSDDQQEAIRLKFQDQLTYREISQIMDKSLGTVSNLITTALSAIRQELRVKIELA